MYGVIFTIALVAAVVIPVLGLAHARDPSVATVAGLVSEGIAAKADCAKNIQFNRHPQMWQSPSPTGPVGSRVFRPARRNR